MLYGSSTGIVAPGLAGARVDRRQVLPEVVRDVERLQVPRGDDVLRQRADREVLDDLERALVDHVDGVAVAVRDVDVRRARRATAALRLPTPVGRVDVRHATCSACRARRASTARARSGRRPCPRRRGRRRRRIPRGVGDRGEVRERGRRACRRRERGACAGSTATIRSVGVPTRAPRPPITNAVEPIAAAAACVVGAGSRPIADDACPSRARTRRRRRSRRRTRASRRRSRAARRPP